MFGHTTPTRRSTIGTVLLLAAALTHLPAQRDSLAQVKSPGTALALSLGVTALPNLAMIGNHGGDGNDARILLAAFVVGPAVGHFYADQSNRGLTGIGIRVGLLGATALLAQGDCEGFMCIPPGVYFGAIALMTDMIVDIAAAPGSARKFNEAHARMAIVPLRDGPRQRLGVGVQLPF